MRSMVYFKIADSPLYTYGMAILFTSIALILTHFFWNLVDTTPLLFFTGAVAVSAWRGGMGPGMFSAAVAIITADYFLLEPKFAVFTNSADLLTFGIFSLIALLISWLEESRSRSARSLRQIKDELDVILNSVPTGITAQDIDGQILFANESVARLCGYPSSYAITGTSSRTFWQNFEILNEHNDPITHMALPHHRVFQHGKPASLTFKMRFTDTGKEKWLYVTTSPVFDDNGKVRRAVNVFQDITEQIETQLYLSYYAELVHNSSDAIIGKTLDGVINSWNSGAEQLYGYTAIEAVGQYISLIFPKDIKSIELEMLDRLKAKETIQHYETRRQHKNGHEIEISLTISPIRDSTGQISGYSTIERDITARKNLERLRQETQERLRRVLDSLMVFVGIMTPEGVLIEANNSALSAARLRPSDVLNKPFEDTYWWAYSADSKERLRDAIQRARQGETVRYDVPVRLAEDLFITIDFTLAPIFDELGEVKYLIPSGIDVTERNRLTEQLALEKRKLSIVLNTLPGIVYQASGSTDAETQHMDFISKYAEEVLGYPLEEWYSVPNFWKTVVHPDDWDEAVEMVNQSYERGSSEPVSFRCITKDGRILHTEAYNSVITDSARNRIGTCGMVIDVTERKQREQEVSRLTSMIEAQRQRLDAIIRNVPGIIYDLTIDIKTGDPKLNFISHYAEKMFGYPIKDWYLNTDLWQSIVNRDDWEVAIDEAQMAFRNNVPGSAELRCKDAYGNEIFTEAFFNFEKNDQEIRQFGVIMDITQRKAIQETLKMYVQELQRSNEELEQFAYVASHDLQEPLRMVTSYLQLIEQRYNDVLDDDGREFISFAVGGASRMKTLINDLISYSRVQRNTAEFSSVDMQQILSNVQHDLQLAIEDTGAVITYDELPQITANAGQMTQLLQNLIGNALKFRGQEPPHVHVGVHHNRSYWVFSIRDNGIGIAPEYHERIFTIFQRLHSRQEYPGTGIGLAICRKIVDKHGGEIWVESCPGEGTTFYFTIPLSSRKRLVDDAYH